MIPYYAVIESSPTTACHLATMRGLGNAATFGREMAKTLTPDGLSVVNIYPVGPDGDLASLVPEMTIDPRKES